MSTITIHRGVQSDGSVPYPFHVDSATGDVQRQDFWQGEIVHVLGFQADWDVQRISVFYQEFVANPDLAVGKFVVAVDKDGNIQQWAGAVTSVTVREEVSQ